MISPFIDPVTKLKIQFISGNADHCKIGELVEPHMVEEFCGGRQITAIPFDSIGYLELGFDVLAIDSLAVPQASANGIVS